VLPYAGRAVVVEAECAQTVRPGHLLNITGGASEWATMAAQVQEVTEEIDTGRTVITFGPPAHIRLDDLIEILKIARNQSDEFGGGGVMKAGSRARKQELEAELTPALNMPSSTEIAAAIVAAYSGKPVPRGDDTIDFFCDEILRYTGRVSTYISPGGTGGIVVSFTVGGITYYARVTYVGLQRRRSQALSPAGVVPTEAEIADAVKAAFDGYPRPFDGDLITLTVSGTPKFEALIDSRLTAASGRLYVAFIRSGIAYYAAIRQLGIY
jgi:hypothetical protein